LYLATQNIKRGKERIPKRRTPQRTKPIIKGKTKHGREGDAEESIRNLRHSSLLTATRRVPHTFSRRWLPDRGLLRGWTR
ncbi:hypothetical protein GW17_00006360, partial [Ensete ventricosum]